jgi:hypothetical protein
LTVIRQRWLGATGRRVPELAFEGELDLPEETLELPDVEDVAALRTAFDAGRPVVVHAESEEQIRRALARPEVSCVLVPRTRPELLELDLPSLTYG